MTHAKPTGPFEQLFQDALYAMYEHNTRGNYSGEARREDGPRDRPREQEQDEEEDQEEDQEWR